MRVIVVVCVSPAVLIGEVYVERILAKLHATLSEAKGLSDAGNMEPLVSFVCDVASTFFSSVRDCLLLASAEELLLTVFQLTAQDQAHTHLSGTYTHTHLSRAHTHCPVHTHTHMYIIVINRYQQLCNSLCQVGWPAHKTVVVAMANTPLLFNRVVC